MALTRVTFVGEEGREVMWAEVCESDRFRLDSIPLYAFGVSLGDVFTAELVDGQLEFRDVLEPSGHSTYRVASCANPPGSAFRFWLGQLAALGCGFENRGRRLVAVDIPPGADAKAVYDLLDHGMSAGAWWFDEMNYWRS